MCLRLIMKHCPVQDGSAHSHRHLGCAGRRHQGEWWALPPEVVYFAKSLAGMQHSRTLCHLV